MNNMKKVLSHVSLFGKATERRQAKDDLEYLEKYPNDPCITIYYHNMVMMPFTLENIGEIYIGIVVSTEDTNMKYYIYPVNDDVTKNLIDTHQSFYYQNGHFKTCFNNKVDPDFIVLLHNILINNEAIHQIRQFIDSNNAFFEGLNYEKSAKKAKKEARKFMNKHLLKYYGDEVI